MQRGVLNAKVSMMDDFTLSTFFEIIRKFLQIVLLISGACSGYYGNRAMVNLNTKRGLMHKTWFFMTTRDALFVPDYYTKKGNMYRVKSLNSIIIFVIAMIALVISLLLAPQ